MSVGISVLCAVYNGERHLEAAIRSVLGQSHREFEFIIVNDGSTDGTAQLLERWARQDARVLVVHQENLGLAAALNRGLRLARGELIARQDADDVSLPRRIERQAAFLRRHPAYWVVGCHYLKIDEHGTLLGQSRPPARDLAIKIRLLDRNAVGHPCAMFRRREILALGGYDERWRCAQDYELWCRVALTAKLSNLREPLVMRREHAARVGVQRLDEQTRAKELIRARYTAALATGTEGSWLLRRIARGYRWARGDQG